MSLFDSLKLIDFDYLEYAVADLDKTGAGCVELGFEKAGTRAILERKLRSHLYVQNDIRIVLSNSEDPKDPVARYTAAHGDGVIDVALRCEAVVPTLEALLSRGAQLAEPPRGYRRDFGAIECATIKTFGDLRHTLISREGNLFAQGFDEPMLCSNEGFGLQRIDHITSNVEKGKLKEAVSFYEKVFGFRNTRFFDIHTERTGLYSYVMESPNGVLKMPFNEPTEAESQIQEFLDVHHGPGIQHVAFLTSSILPSLKHLRKEHVEFLAVPDTYYDELLERVPGIEERLSDLKAAGVLADGDAKGYILQIFTENRMGPFFYEVIQRKGHSGFGEGNFKALFEAIERDQLRRGTLKQS